jgi:hypothetical protein
LSRFVCLSVCLSVLHVLFACFYVCCYVLFVCLSHSLSISLSVWMSTWVVCLLNGLSVWLLSLLVSYVCLSVCLSTWLSDCKYVFMTTFLFFQYSRPLSFYPSIFMSICLSVFRSISVFKVRVPLFPFPSQFNFCFENENFIKIFFFHQDLLLTALEGVT